jgi:hypothetical protein
MTPQQEEIVAIHRDRKWHCSTEYEYIRDHRKRISELNNGYLKEKGFRLVGKPCDGRCGKTHSSTLYMRRAEPLAPSQTHHVARSASQTQKTIPSWNRELLAWFDALPEKAVV